MAHKNDKKIKRLKKIQEAEGMKDFNSSALLVSTEGIEENLEKIEVILSDLGDTRDLDRLRGEPADEVKITKEIQTNVDNKIDKHIDKIEKALPTRKQIKKDVMPDIKKDIKDRVSNLKKSVTPKKGKDYFDGVDADEEFIIERVLAALPEDEEIVFDNTEELIEKINLLKEGDKGIDMNVVNGLNEVIKKLEDDIKQARTMKGGKREFFGSGGGKIAYQINVNTANFNNNLSSADNDVQKALDTLDDLSMGTGDMTKVVYDTNDDGTVDSADTSAALTGAQATAITNNTTHRGSDGTDHANVVLNDTHRASDGKDHSDVILNNTHRSSDGSDHTFIDQSVISGSSPTFTGTNFTGIPASGVSIATGGGSPTVDQVQEYLDNTGSSGFFLGGALSDGGAGTLDVAAGSGFIRTTNDDNAELQSFKWSASAGIAVTDNTTQYVYVDDAGAISLSTDEFLEAPDKILIGVATDEGGAIVSTFSLGVRLEESIGQAGRFIRRVHGVTRDKRRGGLIFGQSGDANRDVTMTTGYLWWGRTDYAISAFDTSGADTFQTYSAGGQEDAVASQWPNAQYDNTGTLTTMTNNKWANLFFWIEPDDTIAMVYGRAEYNSEALAEQESVPSSSLPTKISETGLLASRFTFQKSANTATISSSFDTVFLHNGVTDHGNLAGLGDDDHTQYLLADGTRALSANWDAGSFKITAETLESDIATGTAPFTVASTTEVANLKAATVGTIAGLAPDTATTAAAQTNITSLGTLTALDVDNININGNTIISSDVNGDISLTPNGTGDVNIGTLPFNADQTVGAGQDNYVLTYDNGTGLINLEAAAGGGATVALDNLAGVAINESLVSDTADTDSLGSTTKEWLNLYIGDAGKIYLGLGQDASIERSAANEMTLTATSGVTVEGVKMDGGVVTGVSSITSTGFTGALTGNADTVTGFTPASGSLTLAGADAVTITTTGATNSTLPLGTKTLVATDVATLSSLTSIGTIATGTWEATDVGVPYGGTGASTFTDHGVMLGSGAGALSVTSVGTDGQVFTGNTGADPTWQAAAGGGAWTVIETQTPSSGNTITFTTDLGTYTLYKIYVRGVPSGTGDNIYVRFNTDTTAGNYFWNGSYSTAGATTYTEESVTTDAEGVRMCNSFKADSGNIGEITIINVSSSYETHLMSNFNSIDDAGGTNKHQHQYCGVWESNSALTEILLDMNGSTWSAGSHVMLMGAN